jgi:CzcA family heavy metal efflux pump
MGLAAYQTFPVSILPEVTFPRVIVIAEAGDKPTKTVESGITRPIEEAIAEVPNVKRIVSKTKRGDTEVSVDFNWGTDIFQAEQLVNAKINEIRPDLPADARTSTERMNPTVFPILGLTLTSKTLSPSELYDLAQYTLRPRLARVDGVARVVVQGGLAPEVRVTVDPQRLASLKLSLPEVSQAIAASNVVRSVGRLDYRFQQIQVFVNDETSDVEALKHVVVTERNGAPIELGQLATIANSVEDQTTVVSANGTECVLLNIVRQPSANTVALAAAVKDEMNVLGPTLPQGAQLGIFYDQSVLVRDAIRSVGEAVVIGGVLAVFVLLLFLRDMRATLTTAAIIPLAILITFLFMRIAGLTLNLMTLGALAVGIGLVIDDAIVVVENVFKHLPDSESIAAAVQAASSEIASPMISSTVTTVVVFLPLAFLQGVAGAFFAALAITLSIALMISLGLALLASPSLCAAFLKRSSHRETGRLYERMLDGYERLLRWGMRRPWLIPLSGAVLLAATVMIGLRLSTGFMPAMDEGAFVLDYVTPPGTSLRESDRLLRKVDTILQDTPEVATFSRRTGTELGFSITESNRGDYAVMLKESRHRSIDQVIEDVRGRIAESVPGLDTDFTQVLQDLIGDLAGGAAPIEVKFFGEDEQQIQDIATKFSDDLGKIDGFADIQSGVVQLGPELELNVDSVRAGRLGLTPEAVADQAETSLLGLTPTKLSRADRLVPVRVRFPASVRSDPAAIRNIPIVTPAGVSVPFGSLGSIETHPGSAESTREDQRRVVSVTANTEGMDLSAAITHVQTLLAKTSLPPGVTVELGGQYKSQHESFTNLLEVLALAVLLVYAVMLFQFGSFTAPTVILLIMPLGLFGAVVALWATKTPLNVSSFMGAIMLVGIVVKNGILLLDRAQQGRASGMATPDAVVDAGRRRLRPILMTTLTAILGLFPLALGIGAGAEMQKPLAITVIGGLTFSTIVTLLIGPLLYQRFVGSKPPTKPKPESPPPV